MSFKTGLSGIFAVAILFSSISTGFAQTEAGTEASSESGGVPLTPIQTSAPVKPAPPPTKVQSTRTYSAVKSTTSKPKVVNYHWRTRTRTSTRHR